MCIHFKISKSLTTLCSLEGVCAYVSVCVYVCVSRMTWTWVQLCVPLPLSSLDEYLFSASLSRTPTHAHMCRADGEGARVSASSCVTRLISPQPGRLGPEGRGGEGLVPTAPLINMYLGLLCSKVTRGKEGGGAVCTVRCCWVPARPSRGCVTPSRGMRHRFREMSPSSGLAHPTHSYAQREMLCGHTDIQTLEQASTQAHTR